MHDRLQKATDLDVQMQQALIESEKHKAALLEQVNVLKRDLDRVNSALSSAHTVQENLKQDLSSKNETLHRLEHKQKAEHEALIESHQQITDASNEKLQVAEGQIQALNASLQDSQAEKLKLESKLEQASERIEQLDQSLAQQLVKHQQELSAKTLALQEHDEHFKKLKKSLTQQSETIEKLQGKTTAKATQYQTVLADMQVLLKDKEEAISHLNNIIQTKGAELTKNTDILLREKVKGTELQGQLNVYKQQVWYPKYCILHVLEDLCGINLSVCVVSVLSFYITYTLLLQLEELRARELKNLSQSKCLTDQYTEVALELDNTKKKLVNLQKEKTELDLQVATLKKKINGATLKKPKSEQNPEFTRVYKQLQSMLASELSKNSALRDAVAAGVGRNGHFM